VNIKDLIKQLTKLVKKYPDADVLFDTEAVCFNVHLVDVKNVSLVPKKMLGRDIVCLHWDMNKEPFHYDKRNNK
jgi:hypothetical protein